MAASTRWKNRPEGSTWGDFGPDDQLGRLNLLTPEKVKQGVAEVKEGKVFCLSLPLDYPGGNLLNPRRHPPILRPTLRNGRPNMVYVVQRDNPDATERMRSMTIGARPADGSSRISRRGSPITPCATARICCCPPDRRDAWSLRLSLSSGNRS